MPHTYIRTIRGVKSLAAADIRSLALLQGVTVKVRELLSRLKKDGWQIDRTKGSHRQLVHPHKLGTVTVSGHLSDDVHPKTLRSVLKQAELEHDQ